MATSIEELRDYTINEKSQVYFVDFDNRDDELSSIDQNIITGDIIVYTLQVNNKKKIRRLDVRQKDGTFETMLDVSPNTRNIFCYNLEFSDVRLISESGESFDYYVYGGGGGSIAVKMLQHYPDTENSVLADAKYIYLEGLKLADLQDGDTIRIKLFNDFQTTRVTFFKIEDKFFLADTTIKSSYGSLINIGNSRGVVLQGNYAFDFVYNSKALALSTTHGNAGYVVYDSEANITDILPDAFCCINQRYENDDMTIDFGSIRSDSLKIYKVPDSNNVYNIPFYKTFFSADQQYYYRSQSVLLTAISSNPDEDVTSLAKLISISDKSFTVKLKQNVTV